MRIVFMGSDELACPALAACCRRPGDEVAALVCQPDRPSGRKLKLAPCAAKTLALELGLPVFSPERLGRAEVQEQFRAWNPDLIVVAAYGQYIRPSLLDLPRLGAINLHPSMLPKYRGASPIQWAIADGNRETGVTILHVSEEMDAGDLILQEAHPIGPSDTYLSLKRRLAEAGAHLLMRAMDLLAAGAAPRTPQEASLATYVTKLEKRDGRIDWAMPAEQIECRIRGFFPWPACHCPMPGQPGQPLKVIRARVEPGEGAPGTVLSTEGEGPLVATGTHALRLLEVQPPGGRPMPGDAFLRGHPLPAHRPAWPEV